MYAIRSYYGVGLGQALIHDPPILILDEPTSDLDPNEKAEVISYIREIGKERTVMLSTPKVSTSITAKVATKVTPAWMRNNFV